MIELLINGTSYKAASCWNDVTFAQYVRLSKAQSVAERVHVLTGIPIADVDKMNTKQFVNICALLTFAVPNEAFDYVVESDYTVNVGHESYGKLEAAKQAIAAEAMPHLAGVKVMELYTGENISDAPVLEVMGKVINTIIAIDNFLKEFKELYAFEPTAEQIVAGIGEIMKLGFMPTVVNLARQYSTTHDNILNMPAREVYMVLLTDFRKSQYEENLIKLQTKQRK